MTEEVSGRVAKFRMTKAMAKLKINSASRLSENVIVNQEIYAWAPNMLFLTSICSRSFARASP